MAKVLVVEDDVDIGETYVDILEGAGHTVEFVDRAAKAFGMLTKMRPDVAILDMQLPGDSGILVVAYIRSLRRLSCTKILIISGYPEMAKRAIDVYKADLFLNKPVSPDQLRRTISDLSTNQAGRTNHGTK